MENIEIANPKFVRKYSTRFSSIDAKNLLFNCKEAISVPVIEKDDESVKIAN